MAAVPGGFFGSAFVLRFLLATVLHAVSVCYLCGFLGLVGGIAVEADETVVRLPVWEPLSKRMEKA